MTETLFSAELINTPLGFTASLIVGVLFGAVLEKAGFGSARRIAGVFYFTDMAVVKVMFSALITAMVGLIYLNSTGLLYLDAIYQMPTVWGAQLVGGIIFGAGFVMSGWCPGTSAVGVASGKIDALVFFGGVMIGSIFFNEVFETVKPLYGWGRQGVLYAYDSIGTSKEVFVLLFSIVAVAAFWVSEYFERRKSGTGKYLNTRFQRTFGGVLVVLALGVFILPKPLAVPAKTKPFQVSTEQQRESGLMAQVEQAADHIEPEELADRMMLGKPGLLVVDVRDPLEYRTFHLKGAINIPLEELAAYLAAYKNRGLIVLYSNGMTHPAQARDSLNRLRFNNVYFLTDGLNGFSQRCLKPISLRNAPVSKEMADKIKLWREYFLR
jgi:rhodanese-related sulfurtransferase/uncharacterized membrane protein YedE/YeeE